MQKDRIGDTFLFTSVYILLGAHNTKGGWGKVQIKLWLIPNLQSIHRNQINL